MSESSFDRAREIVERYGAGFVGPLTFNQWRCLKHVADRCECLKWKGTFVAELSPYMKALLRMNS